MWAGGLAALRQAGELEGEGGERGRWLLVWSVLGGRRPAGRGWWWKRCCRVWGV